MKGWGKKDVWIAAGWVTWSKMKKRRGGRTINYENVQLKEQGSKHGNKYLMIQNNSFACEPCSCTVTVFFFGP